MPRANEVPRRKNPVPPVAPHIPKVNQRVLQNPKVSLAPATPVGAQANPPMVREDLLYERFRHTKAPEFEGLTSTIEAYNWFMDIQVILDFMGLME